MDLLTKFTLPFFFLNTPVLILIRVRYDEIERKIGSIARMLLEQIVIGGHVDYFRGGRHFRVGVCRSEGVKRQGKTTKRTMKGSVIIPLALLWDQTRRSRQTRQLEWIFEIPGGTHFLRSLAKITEQYRFLPRCTLVIDFYLVLHIKYLFSFLYSILSKSSCAYVYFVIGILNGHMLMPAFIRTNFLMKIYISIYF